MCIVSGQSQLIRLYAMVGCEVKGPINLRTLVSPPSDLRIGFALRIGTPATPDRPIIIAEH